MFSSDGEALIPGAAKQQANNPETSTHHPRNSQKITIETKQGLRTVNRMHDKIRHSSLSLAKINKKTKGPFGDNQLAVTLNPRGGRNQKERSIKTSCHVQSISPGSLSNRCVSCAKQTTKNHHVCI